MVRVAIILFFITPPIYYMLFSFFSGEPFQFRLFISYIVSALYTGTLGFIACSPYYFYPKDIQKYVILGGSIGINLMYMISMANVSKTVIFAELGYIETPIAAIPALLFKFSDVWKSNEYKPYVYLLAAMVISIIGMLPVFAEISREIDMPMGG